MLDRLNFYDLYAYLFLGLVWLTLVSLPFCYFSGLWPSDALLSTLASVIAGYTLGHVMYLSTRKAPGFDVRREGRFDSQRVLDEGDPSFSVLMKERIRARSVEFFGIDPGPQGDAVRQDVFELARSLLNRRRQGYAAEQFQGMYALTRGLAGAAFLAGAFYLGFGAWALLLSAHRYVTWALLAVLVLSLIAIRLWKSDLFGLAFLLGGMAVLGSWLAWLAGRTNAFMIAAGVVAVVIALMLLGARRRFQLSFAKAVWAGLVVTEPLEGSPARQA